MTASPGSIRLALALAHFFCASALTGLIWMVQVVTYPQFFDVGQDAFDAFHDRYLVLVARVVMPLMLAEIALACVLLVACRRTNPAPWTVVSVILLGGIWCSTALLQAPAHGELGSGFSADTAAGLAASNWIRTILWTARSAVAGILVWLIAEEKSAA